MTLRPVGIRVDIDTHDGLRHGVPRLLAAFDGAGVSATFYFSMGPDNAGRAILNVFRPGFLRKMIRTGAPSLYGWRTTLSGTLLPARPIGSAFPELLRETEVAGHEVGVHAWNHRAWQDGVLGFSSDRAARELDLGYESFRDALGHPPASFAAPAWITSEAALLHQEDLDLEFASDCRGTEPFYPMVGGRRLRTPQVPATLATLDEALGATHHSAGAYFEDAARLAARQPFPVLTVHAEVEGGPYSDAFRRFLEAGPRSGLQFCPLGRLLRERMSLGPALPSCGLTLAPVPGRHGQSSLQHPAESS